MRGFEGSQEFERRLVSDIVSCRKQSKDHQGFLRSSFDLISGGVDLLRGSHRLLPPCTSHVTVSKHLYEY